MHGKGVRMVLPVKIVLLTGEFKPSQICMIFEKQEHFMLISNTAWHEGL